MGSRPGDVAAWLRQKPSLTQVAQAYPREWKAAQRDISRLVESGDPDGIRRYLAEATQPARASPDRARPAKEMASQTVQRYLTMEALNQAYLAASTGVSSGSLRLGLVNGLLLQRLLFEGGLRRKPVNLLAFRLVWPLLTQRRRLMPLVRQQGIYCFYSGHLIAALAHVIGGRRCLEIAAGDGTLSRFLAARSVDIVATDDYSWSGTVTYNDTVARRDARSALAAYRPEVVICSWPPPGNDFERRVFATESVQLYIVISSGHESAAGNWAAYRGQADFDWATDTRLSRMLLPPENRGAVYLFSRR